MPKIELDKLAGPSGGQESQRLAKHWLDQINTVKDSAEHKRWVKRGETIEKRYRDERNRVDEEGQRRYNSLWSNVEILTPALYGRMPLPVCERRFKDKDPTGRGAAIMLERALRNEIEICGYDEALRQAVGDYLLPGRGTVWVRYEPEIEESVSLPPDTHIDMRDSMGNLISGTDTTRRTANGRLRPEIPDEEETSETTEKLEDTGDRIVRESTPVDFVPWDCFFTFPIRARIWKEVTALGKLVFMSRDQLTKRFGKQIGKKIPLEKDERGLKQQNATLQSVDEDKARVYEIWNRADQCIYWVAIGYDYLCDKKEDPLKLENFWPCPKPLYANGTNNTLIPVPDYIQYQDQAIQIDELTQRIAMLTKACKMAGVYNSAAKEIARLFDESIENELIPVDDWAAFGKDGGGVEGNWSLMPVSEIIQIINELMTAKSAQIEEMDRLTGINDIMRGTSDARETLGGVRLRTNSTGTRLSYRQNEVARFARDTLRIMADIMCQHFSPRSLIEVSGVLYEEGLGPDDVPQLTDLQTPQPAPPMGQIPPPAPGAPPGPMNQPVTPQGPFTGMGAGAPQPGTNVIPFPGGPPPGQPPAPPPQPGPQEDIRNKLVALQRIVRAIELLRNERLRGFRVDIEVDSTIYADAAQDREDRNNFIVATTGFLEKALAIGGQMPEAIPLLGKLLQFTARGHRIGRDLETAIEEFTDEASLAAKQRLKQAQQQPNPDQLKAQTDAKLADAKIASLGKQDQINAQKAQTDLQKAQFEAQADSKAADAEIARQQIENEGERFNSAADMQMKNADIEMKLIEKRMEEMRLQIEMLKMQQAERQMQREEIQAAEEAAQRRQEMTHENAQNKREASLNKLQMSHEIKHENLEHKHTTTEMEHEKELLAAKVKAEKAKAAAAAAKPKPTSK